MVENAAVELPLKPSEARMVEKVQGVVDLRAHEIAVEARTLAQTLKTDIVRLDTHLTTMRSENASQHKEAQSKIEKGNDQTHGRINSLYRTLLCGMAVLAVTLFGLWVQVAKIGGG